MGVGYSFCVPLLCFQGVKREMCGKRSLEYTHFSTTAPLKSILPSTCYFHTVPCSAVPCPAVPNPVFEEPEYLTCGDVVWPNRA